MNTALEGEKKVAAEDYFLLAIRNWDDKLKDFLPVGDPSTTTQTFNEYPNAEKAFFSTNHENYPQAGGKDVKLELLHMRFGIPHIVRNRILFP